MPRSSVRRVAGKAVAATLAATLVAVGFTTLAGVTTAAAAPAAAVAVRPLLHPGQSLRPGDSIADAASGQTLTMQTDGNLVQRYVPAGRVLFATRTFVAGSVLTNQTDGNVVVRDPSGRAVYSTGARQAGDLTLSPCGALLQGRLLTACASGDVRSLLFGSRTSPDGRTTMTMQTDGNLVLRTTAGGHGNRLLWATYTAGAVTATVQADGNFVLRRGSSAIWASNTPGRNCSKCYVSALTRDDGNFLVTSTPPSGAPVAIWASGTTVLTWGDQQLVITSHSLGNVRIGMTVAQARAAAVVPVEGPSAPSCPVYSVSGDGPSRGFVVDTRTGRVNALLTGNSGPLTDVTDRGVTPRTTPSQVLAIYGASARSYTDIYGSFVILVRFADGNEVRFDAFNGRGGPLSYIQAGAPSVVERTELCG